nr:alpha/beta fold hydrolase [Xanthomonas sp. D-109]
MYCFAYAGGNASTFLDWQALMPDSIEVCGVQLPGRGARFREAPIHLLSALIRELAPAFSRTVDRRFAFFGHSLGGLIAFELSRALAQLGAVLPTHLFLSGVHAPRFRDHERNYHRLDDAGLAQVLRNYGATPSEILDQPDLLALLLPTIRADFAMAETYRYRPGPRLSVPITALAGRDDERRTLDQVDGWALETNAEFSTCWFDGGHFFLNPCRAEVIDLVLSRLRNPSAPMSVRHVS